MSFSALSLAALLGFIATLAIAFATWTLSVFKKDVSIVDSAWSLMIFAAAFVYLITLPEQGPRANWAVALACMWAVRLGFYVTWRNWGEPEDRRYQAIRERNQPNFEWKSLYLVFALQAVLAWLVSVPLLAAAVSPAALGWLDGLGIGLFFIGLAFETISDQQLARFKSDPANKGRVLDTGLWRYTRHPNYFGEFCVWWAFYLIALAGGGWWAIVSPLLMSLLLLRISGVTLLEKDIGERRPAYRAYIDHTNAFFPGLPRAGGAR